MKYLYFRCISIVVVCYFNDGHVLQLWSETIVICRWMRYDNQDKFGLNFLTFVLTVEGKLWKKPRLGN